MAGKIIADQIEHSTAGSLDTSYVVQGSAKSWIRFNGSGTVAINDSLNAASLTDHGTGEYSYSYTNAMNNADYTANLFARDTVYDRAHLFQSSNNNSGLLSTTGLGGFCSSWTGAGNWSAGTDALRLGMVVHGDLA